MKKQVILHLAYQIILPLVYQIIAWLLYYVHMYLLSSFLNAILWFLLGFIFVGAFPLVYYVLIEQFRIGPEKGFDYVIQTVSSFSSNIFILIFVLEVLIGDTHSDLSLNFSGLMELLFAVINTISFVSASVIVAVLAKVKAARQDPVAVSTKAKGPMRQDPVAVSIKKPPVLQVDVQRSDDERRKQVLLPLFYQIIVWLLYYVHAYILPDFLGDEGEMWWFALCCLFLAFSPLVYYLVSIKLFRTKTEMMSDYVVQIASSIFFNIVIFIYVVCVLIGDTHSDLSLNFSGLMEFLFVVLNIISFVYASVIAAIMKRASAKEGKIFILVHIGFNIVLPLIVMFVATEFDGGKEPGEYAQERQQEQQLLDNMLEAKDAEITYNTYFVYYGGMHGTSYTSPTMFIDYDTYTVGFLDHAEYTQYQLKKTVGETSKYHVQAQWKLISPGKSITTYYLNEKNSYRTIALRLDMEDGTTYELGEIEKSEEGAILDIYEAIK